jgi:SAM-dependent methyltransferase
MSGAPSAPPASRELAGSEFASRQPARRAKLLADIDVAAMAGLEIGALDRPIVAPGDGNIRFADYRDQAALRREYRADPTVDPRRIVAVDFVLGTRSLTESIPPDVRFDYIVASHVIEHVPDVVGWLQETSRLLVPGGRLCLAIPDKRYSFDYLGAVSTPGDFLDAYLNHRRAPSVKQLYDFLRTAAHVNPARAWLGLVDPHRLTRWATPEAALQACRDLQAGQPIEIHCFLFTPQSFLALFDELVIHRLTDFRIARFCDTAPLELEFFVTLEKLERPDDTVQRASIPRLRARAPLLRLAEALAVRAARRLRRRLLGS